jgi:hypothetical protein
MQVITIESKSFRQLLEQLNQIKAGIDTRLKKTTLDDQWLDNNEVCKWLRQLYGKKLTSKNFKKLFAKVNGSVFCYGPDTGMLEKFFKWKFRDKFRCVNLMKVFKDHIKTGSFKLKDLEHKFGIRRQVVKYKTSIFQIWRE